MFGVKITTEMNGQTRKSGEVQPNLNEVKRYLMGRVKEVKAEEGTYETVVHNPRFSRPSDPVIKATVTIKKLGMGESGVFFNS